MIVTDMQADHTLDCTGMSCPLPIVKTSKAMKQIEVGQILKVIATDPGAPADMQAWARQTGNELLDSQQDGTSYTFHFRRMK